MPLLQLFKQLSYIELTWRKTDDKRVNIFRKRNYHINISLSTHCKTYCFAFQKRLFCTVKA